ncbi:MAG: hypothetical protein ACKPE6_05865 [Gammaproteobacteria bacterium]
MNTLLDALAGPPDTTPRRGQRKAADPAEPSFAAQVMVFYPYPQPAADAQSRATQEARNRQVQPCAPGAGSRRRGQRGD